jgi:isoquinoline 1-oxidoreductase subunit alpha
MVTPISNYWIISGQLRVYLRQETDATVRIDAGVFTVQLDESAVLSCSIPMKKVMNKSVVTAEESEQMIQNIFSYALQKAGTAECSYCVPEVIMRARIFLKNNSNLTYEKALRVAKINLCRCIGRHKIASAVIEVSEILMDESRMMKYKISDEIREE